MNEQINERIVNITKTANIEQDLQVGHDYEVAATVHCQKGGALDDNHDGTFNKTYHLQLQGEFEIKNDLGERIVAKTKGSPADKWRWEVNESGNNYKQFMGKMIDHSEEVIEFVKKL